ncbi:ECF-type sigma factor [Desulfovibrio sp.]|uniref:ECF-type sigma factor n=1 Tax=Desulfovibrio sp. TaxID=885 RepID=UPI003D10EC5F
MARQDNKDNAAMRALRIAELLFGRILDGYSNKEIADTLGYSACNVSRDLELLRQSGWAEKLDTGRWALTTRPVALMRKYQDYMADLAARRDAFDARVQAQAKNL